LHRLGVFKDFPPGRFVSPGPSVTFVYEDEVEEVGVKSFSRMLKKSSPQPSDYLISLSFGGLI
jgi:hypothetical protein